jgi:hypothetical protein
MRQIILQCCCRTVFDLVSIRTAFSFVKRPLGQNAFSPDHRFLSVSASPRLRGEIAPLSDQCHQCESVVVF